MAITINEQPSSDSIYPVYNPIRYAIESTNAGETNFKLLVTVLTDLSDPSTVCTLKYDKYPGVNEVLADVHRVMQSEIVESVTNVQQAALDIQEESGIKAFQVQFQEFYGAIPAATGAVSSGNTLYAMNAAYTYVDWAKTQDQDEINWSFNFGNAGSEQDYNNWLTPFSNNASSVSGTTVTLSRSDKFYPIEDQQYLPLRFRHDTTEARIQYQTFTEDLTLNQTGTIANTGLSAVPKMLMVQITSSSLSLNTYASGSITLTSSDRYLAVMYLDHSSNRNSVVKLYEIIWNPCRKFDDSYEIHWLNRQGGWDSYIFNAKSEQYRDNEKFDYQRITTTLENSAIVDNVNALKTGRYYTSFKDRYVVNSFNVEEWFKEGMADLYTSPQVYWRHPDLGFIQIKNTTNNQYRFNKRTDGTFNVRFEFVIDHNNLTQRG